nr:hypothetical protein CFP56_56077 [Quercus suber]
MIVPCPEIEPTDNISDPCTYPGKGRLEGSPASATTSSGVLSLVARKCEGLLLTCFITVYMPQLLVFTVTCTCIKHLWSYLQVHACSDRRTGLCIICCILDEVLYVDIFLFFNSSTSPSFPQSGYSVGEALRLCSLIEEVARLHCPAFGQQV